MSTTALDNGLEIESFLRKDWYQATIRNDRAAIDPEYLPNLLGDSLGAATRKETHGLNGYKSQSVLYSAEGAVVARILQGGSNQWPNAFASGDRAPAFADVIKDQFPYQHAVTRVDVAYDVQAPDAFDRLQSVILQVADERNLAVSQAGDWHRGIKGRSLYVGAASSQQRCVLYEKGKEQRAKAPTAEAAALVPLDLVRLELRVTPDKLPRRLLAASASNSELFGFSLWTKKLAQAAFSVDVPRVHRLSWQRPEDEDTWDWMSRQYSAFLLRQKEAAGGDWEPVLAKLVRLIERNEAMK